MKRKIFSLIIIFIFSSVSAAQDSRIDDLLFRGNNAYQNDNYEEALKYYNEIVHEGYSDPKLYYNIGNCYFKIDQLGMAILFYEKALKISPNDEDAKFNLSVANARIVDRIKEVPKLFIFAWWETIVTTFSVTGWAFIVALLFLSFLGISLFWLFTKVQQLKQISFMIGGINLGILIISIFLLTASINHENANDYAVLISNSAAAKVSPGTKSSDAFIIHEGVKFSVLNYVNGWYEIKLPDGKVGWLPETTLEII